MTNLNQRQTFSTQIVNFFKLIILLIILTGIGNVILRENKIQLKRAGQHLISSIYGSPPLVMEGGDPYIRALMRTISFSESNYLNPYHVIYSGEYVNDLSKHPNICMTIVRGPNKGKCTTAAGRYQFLNTTWAEKAAKYHPHPSKFLLWKDYSFEPEYQDQVLYNWLMDSQAWEKDIRELLKKNKIDDVLRMLSPTWTSLGYGLEDNNMTKYLPKVYQKFLQEELMLSQK